VSSLIEAIQSKASGAAASEQVVADAEIDMGITFSEQLRAIYLGVSNGGIGPGYQILGVKGGHLSDELIFKRSRSARSPLDLA